MSQPCFVLAGDDHSVTAALTADLAHRFGNDYAILADHADSAATTLERLAADGTPVALIIAAQQVEEMPGAEFLARMAAVHPRAKRVLLLGRGEWRLEHPAVRAMSLGQIDSYLFVPWSPRERWLYLPVTEFLAEWTATQAPTFEVMQIVGASGERRAHDLRDALTRSGVPYRFHPAGSASADSVLDDAGLDGDDLPVAVFYTGEVLVQPDLADLYAALGFHTSAQSDECDVIVVGAGPAGLGAAVYGASEGLRTLVLEPQVPGGQAGTSSLIRNYLGFPRGLSGQDLANRATEQAWFFGAEFVLSQPAIGLRVEGVRRIVTTADGREVAARAVIIATGVSWRQLDVPNLDRLSRAGVFYGAAGSEARALEGERVFVVGAGNSAGQAAVHLAKYAESVTVLVRGGSLATSMSDYLVTEIDATRNIHVRLRTEIADASGSGRLEALTLHDRARDVRETVPATAVFVMIGARPRTDWLGETVVRDEQGYVVTGHDLFDSANPPADWPLARPPMLLETSVPGVFAAGDVRHRSVKRVASAVGSGAIAVQLVHEYLADG